MKDLEVIQELNNWLLLYYINYSGDFNIAILFCYVVFVKSLLQAVKSWRLLFLCFSTALEVVNEWY